MQPAGRQIELTVGDAEAEDRYAWERTGAFEVAPGVHRLPLPLPGDGLKAVNVYALTQPDGIVLIDAGWALGQARSDLEAGLAALDHDLGDVTRVLVTHVHRDHYELAMVLRRDFGSRIALGRDEEPSLQELLGVPDLLDSQILVALRREGGGDLADVIVQYRQRNPMEVPIQWELPDEWLVDQQQVTLADRTLRVIATPGHTRGHVVFVDDDAGLLFAGDHVLPHITPSIGFESAPARSPLGSYLASLAIVRAMPDLRLLPAHGPVRPTTHDRVDALLAHHDDRLRACMEAVPAADPATAWEVAGRLPWTRRETVFSDLDPFNQMLAVNETAAHLIVLVDRGLLHADVEDEVRRYRR